MPDESYWVIDEAADGTRELQVVLAKAGAFTRWEGVLVDEEEDTFDVTNQAVVRALKRASKKQAPDDQKEERDWIDEVEAEDAREAAAAAPDSSGGTESRAIHGL